MLVGELRHPHAPFPLSPSSSTYNSGGGAGMLGGGGGE